MLLGIGRDAVYQHCQLDDPVDRVEVAHSRMQRSEKIYGNSARRFPPLLGGHLRTQLADPGFSVPSSDVTAHVYQVTCPHVGHKGGDWRGYCRKSDPVNLEILVD